MKYDHKAIENKWQKVWEEGKFFRAETGSPKPKFYPLIEFPYPSGDGLHMGHTRPYTAMDIVARARRKKGQNVMYPIGFDAFGLPTENYAIKNKMHPREVTEKNIERISAQFKLMGYSFEWDRVVDTTDPDYMRWTQWIFLQFFKHGLAYKKSMPVNWCTSCKIVLANEEVVDGRCERCEGNVIRKEKSQWMLAITKYAQRLIDDLEGLDYPERVKTQQINWIGRSEGAEIFFDTTAGEAIDVYTTRPDTIFGATYMVLSPEHDFLNRQKDKIKNFDEIEKYCIEAGRKSDFERTELQKEKDGVCIEGIKAINPLSKEEIPIFVSDYVLMGYGTGAIMAVPAHDQRDWDFAKKFSLPMLEVCEGGDIEKEAFTEIGDEATVINSGFISGLKVKDAIDKMTEHLEKEGQGKRVVNYKLRDWIFSRQRYWGEPIPLVLCPKCGWVPMPEEELPLLLPEVESYEPTDTGESPLAKIESWVKCKCPSCGGDAERETDTMPNWAGSSWYYLRYMDPHCDTLPVSKEAIDYWDCVDWYNGGMEHTTLHLLYSRFWHKFLYDIGLVNTKEPYKKRTSHGMLLGSDNEKMSKSRGNVVNPDNIIEAYGADTLRVYMMFIGDFEKTAPWSDDAVKGSRRFLDRVFRLLSEKLSEDEESYSEKNEREIHKTIKKVEEDIENMKFNTAIAALMSLVNTFYENGINRAEAKTFLSLLSPFAPHIAEELWEVQGFEGYADGDEWPKYDESKTVEDIKEIAVQVNGKLRATFNISTSAADEEYINGALALPKIEKYLDGHKLVKTIVVKNRLVNLIIK